MLFVLCAAIAAVVAAPSLAQETKTPETKASETKTPETKAAEPKTPETDAPETKAPETKAAEPKTPETNPPGTKAAEKCPRGAVGDIPDSLRTVPGEADGTTFYRHQFSPPGPGEEAFFLYIGKKACDVWLRIRIQFPGTKPSGNLRIRVKADDKSYEFPARRLTQSEDPNARGYWYDELVEPDHLLMLFKVAASARAAVRLVSASGFEEHVVSDREKQALTIVLGAYHSLGGKLSRGAVGDEHAVATASGGAHAARVALARRSRPERTPVVRRSRGTRPGNDTPTVLS